MNQDRKFKNNAMHKNLISPKTQNNFLW